jgi:hypothetical protein
MQLASIDKLKKKFFTLNSLLYDNRALRNDPRNPLQPSAHCGVKYNAR